MAAPKRTLILVVGVLLAASAAANVRAWYVSPRKVAEQSGLVVLATVESARAMPSPVDGPTPILTEYVIAVEKVWKGDPALAGKKFAFRQVGGTWNGTTTRGEPHPDYQPGQKWVLALVRVPHGWWTAWGIRHGAFRVDGLAATRDFTGFQFIDGTRMSRETFRLDELEQSMRGTRK